MSLRIKMANSFMCHPKTSKGS